MWFFHFALGVCVSAIPHQKQSHQHTGEQMHHPSLIFTWVLSLVTCQTLKDEYVEIQAFCLEYSKVKEASALYRLVKTLEGGGAPTYQWHFVQLDSWSYCNSLAWSLPPTSLLIQRWWLAQNDIKYSLIVPDQVAHEWIMEDSYSGTSK